MVQMGVCTWTRLRVAGLRVNPMAVFTAIFARWIGATARVVTAATGLGAHLGPFGPVTVHHGGVVRETAPSRGIAGGGKVQGIDAAQVTDVGLLLGAPGGRHGASKGVARNRAVPGVSRNWGKSAGCRR